MTDLHGSMLIPDGSGVRPKTDPYVCQFNGTVLTFESPIIQTRWESTHPRQYHIYTEDGGTFTFTDYRQYPMPHALIVVTVQTEQEIDNE